MSLPFDNFDRWPWHYYGHQQLIEWKNNGLHLGRVPENPTNTYPSGEKLLLGALLPSNVTATATFQFLSNFDGNAGIIVRCTAPAVGFHAFRGYYIAVDPMARSIFVGKMDGSNYHELSRRNDVTIDVTGPQVLTVTVVGNQIDIYFNDEKQLSIQDCTYARGSAGIRVCDTHALFSNFEVSAARRDFSTR